MGKASDPGNMQRFWDARARENPYFFVDNRLEYQDPDTERFWADGVTDLETLLGCVGAQVRESDQVVEIGCGLGRLTRPLAMRAGGVDAIDVSSEMLARAKQLNAALGNVRWVHGDGTTLTGVDDASADLCVSHVVFQHLPDPGITLGYVREMGRVLRPGGRSVFCISNDEDVHRPRDHGRLRNVARRLGVLVGRTPRGERDPAWVGSAVDLGELAEVSKSAGLEVVRVEYPGTQYCVVRLLRSPA